MTIDQTSSSGSDRRRQVVWVVLPAFNEERALPSLLERLDDSMVEAGLSYEVVLVDDGSTDGTADVAKAAAERIPMRIETHTENQGLGATIRDGLQTAAQLASERDVIVTLDADNSHTPELILRMVRLVREGNDVVIASRYQSGSRVRGVPYVRRLISYFGNLFLKSVFPIPGVRDYTCGYRAYRAQVLQEVLAADPGFFDQDGFQVMVDVLLKLRRNRRLVFGEAPLILRYDLKEGESKMDVGSTIRDTLGLVVRRRFDSR